MEVAATLWDWVSTPTAPPPLSAILVLCVLGAAVTFHPQVWRKGRYAATWVHEAGHAIVAILSGRTVTSMTVGSQSGGLTEHVGAAHGLGRIATAAAGYPAPAILGAITLALVGTGNAHWAVALIVTTTVVLLPLQRSWRALLLAVAIGGGTVAISIYLASVESWLLVAMSGYLIAASPRTIVELHQTRKSGPVEGDSDADALASLTAIPAVVWEGVFLLISFASAAAAAWLTFTANG